MAVNITGTVLASLFYEHSSCIGDQTGFLVGDIVQHVRDTISDSQINNVEVKTKAYVFDCIPCPRDQQFHDSKGDILKQKIIDLLPEKHQNIVGWYSFRRNSTIRPSFRERLLHYNLCEALGQDVKMFLFLLCSSRASTNRSTHTFDHSFLHMNNNIFKKVAVDIINLGDTTHAEYRYSPSHTVADTHGAFSRIVKTHEGDFLNTHGHIEVKQIQVLNGAIRKQLDVISQSVIESESRCSEMEQEVAQYRKRAKLKLLEQQQQQEQQQHSLQQNKPKVKKGPSVDDILSMDQVDDLPSELPLQGHSDSTDGQSASEADLNEQMETENSGDACVNDNKSFKVKLTTPAVSHTRSSSVPVDNQSDSSQLNVLRTRSRSGDANDDRNKQKDTKVETSETRAKSSDPFAFVGSMMAESKKDTHKHSKTRSKTKNSDSDVAMETDDFPSNQKHLRQNVGAAASAAKTLNQSSYSTRGQRLKGQEQEVRVGHDEMEGATISSKDFKEKGDNDNPEKTKKGRENIGNMKTCGQESGQKQNTEMADESSSSQDTYTMDISSSPVY